jgi:hypothetical protein
MIFQNLGFKEENQKGVLRWQRRLGATELGVIAVKFSLYSNPNTETFFSEQGVIVLLGKK